MNMNLIAVVFSTLSANFKGCFHASPSYAKNV